jgi:hypothetical protein
MKSFRIDSSVTPYYLVSERPGASFGQQASYSIGTNTHMDAICRER